MAFFNSVETINSAPMAQHFKNYAYQSMNCQVQHTAVWSGKTKCDKCCIPRPYPQAGYQYTAKTKAAQAPKTCTGAGVTAGGTPGEPACSIGTCDASTCGSDNAAFTSNTLLEALGDDSVYSPIGMIYGDPKYDRTKWYPNFEHFIKDELIQHGPMAVAFTVTHQFDTFFDSNKQGVMSVPAAPTEIHASGGHAVAIVGWGVDGSSQKYWLVRNSWGRDWADSGFFRMEMGGTTSDRVGFTTVKHGMWANAPTLQTGGSYNLNRRLKELQEERRLATVTMNATTYTPTNHGGREDCSAAVLGKQVKELRDWFLANKTNYKGVSSSCPVPWEQHTTQGDCKVQIAQGFHLHLTIHVKDCNGDHYHIVTRMAYKQGLLSTAKVLDNSGPEKVIMDQATTNAATVGSVPTGAGTTGNASNATSGGSTTGAEQAGTSKTSSAYGASAMAAFAFITLKMM